MEEDTSSLDSAVKKLEEIGFTRLAAIEYAKIMEIDLKTLKRNCAYLRRLGFSDEYIFGTPENRYEEKFRGDEEA